MRPATVAVALLEEAVGDPRQRPHLSAVGMSAEEEVYPQAICFGHSVGLVVEDDDGACDCCTKASPATPTTPIVCAIV